MIIPSIDLQGGQVVQLVGGKEKALDAGDPTPIMHSFTLAGEVAVIDLDQALSTGSNRHLITPLLDIGPCRVGGGIRDVNTAVQWLDAGASKVILGTAAKPEVLSQLPRSRVIAALDAYHGEVVIKGWTAGTGTTIIDRMRELRDHVGGFLVTFVEREGRMVGIDLDLVKQLKHEAGNARLTIAGGIATAEEIAAVDALDVDAQVGMALYTGRFSLADAIAAPLKTDRPDGLYPTVVVDERGVALGLAYSSLTSLAAAVKMKRGVYHSRSRGGLWVKGDSSGATQELLRIDLDCDRDALRFVVRQAGSGFCHRGTPGCWDWFEPATLGGLPALAKTIDDRQKNAPPGSYTRRLFDDPALANSKLLEEAHELSEANDPADAAAEAADVIYFALVNAARKGATLQDIEKILDRRALKVTRRPGNAK
jgi:phosphoribosyl-ATP pyrophosphohydrolase